MEAPEQRGELRSLDPRPLGNKQAWLPGDGIWTSLPLAGRDGKWPLEAGQPHLVGIGFDMCF